MLRRLPETELRRRPAPDAWCVLECVEHLTLTTRVMIPVWEAAISAGRAAGKLNGGPYRYGFLLRRFLNYMEPPYTRGTRTAPAFEPASGLMKESVLSRYQAAHADRARVLDSARGVDVAAIRIQSPFSKWVRYPAGFSFDLAAAHERRHLWQAARIAEGLARTAASGDAA